MGIFWLNNAKYDEKKTLINLESMSRCIGQLSVHLQLFGCWLNPQPTSLLVFPC